MSDSTIDEKYEALRRAVRETGGLAIAFSGGVDSTFLAAVAHDVLAERAVAITALSPTYAAREQAEARELAKRIGIRQIEVKSNELEVEGFAQNPHNRCYFCKSELYQVVQTEARSASSITPRAKRSFTEPKGLNASILTKRLTPGGANFPILTIGVLPTVSKIFSNLCILAEPQ